jgi:hypothetical protein
MQARRSAIIGLGFAAAAVAAAPAPAAWQQVPNWETVYFLNGTCGRLVTPGQDRTSQCTGTLVHMVYRDGRTSYAFSQGASAMISFSGVEQVSEHKAGSLRLDHVSIATSPGSRVESQEASGSCTFTNPFRGEPATIRCSARTAKG